MTVRAAIAIVLFAIPAVARAQTRSSDTALGPEDLERLAARLRSDDVETRRAAVRALLDAEPASAPALRARLFREYGPSPTRLFNAMRDARPRTRRGEEPDDLLEVLVVADRSREREAIDASLEIVALIRALAATRTLEATTALIDFSLRERGTFSREVGRSLRSMGDSAIPGLLRARQHENRPTRVWCARLLEEMGRSLPAQTVQQTDNELLGQILLAYAAVHDPDAMRVLVSFTGSERTAVREAARAGLREYGQNALWALRSAYENHTGEEPPTAWGWERTSRELYARYDAARLEEPNRLFDEAMRHAKAGETQPMLAKFRQALARQPSFPRRGEMVEPLLEHADDLQEDGREQDALRVCQLALRLDPAGPKASALRARIAYLEGRRALAAGVPDEGLFAEAVRLDPDLDAAQDELDRLQRERQRGSIRTAQAVLAAVAGVLGMGAIGWWTLQRRRKTQGQTG